MYTLAHTRARRDSRVLGAFLRVQYLPGCPRGIQFYMHPRAAPSLRLSTLNFADSHREPDDGDARRSI